MKLKNFVVEEVAEVDPKPVVVVLDIFVVKEVGNMPVVAGIADIVGIVGIVVAVAGVAVDIVVDIVVVEVAAGTVADIVVVGSKSLVVEVGNPVAAVSIDIAA